jgi:hypothetical protein
MKHHMSVFEKETDLIKSIIDIHLKGNNIDADFTFFKGNFYKDGLNKPEYCYDIKPQFEYVIKQDNSIYYFGEIYENKFKSIMIDPPFMIANRPSQKKFYSSGTHGYYESFDDLENSYVGFLRNAYIRLDKNGICIFKCQDFTDTKTILTHAYVWKWASENGFYVKDLAILNKEKGKVYNSKTKQRHLRKSHTYFFILEKENKKPFWYKELENEFNEQ